jgi:hypothetical protein
MAKYSEEVRKVRSVSKKEIPKILKKKPMKILHIIEFVKIKYPELCDDSIKCECGGFAPNRVEWKHQIRWAIADLKYFKKITYSNETELYELI